MRLAVFAALGMVLASPALADVVDLKEGDVYCVGYDAASNTCATVQTLKDLGDGRYQFVDVAAFDFANERFEMVSTFIAVEEDGKICVEDDGYQISIQPKSSELAAKWQTTMQRRLDELTAQNYCFEHEECGGEWIAIGSLGGERKASMSLMFTIFPADDPRAATVQPRYLTVEETAELQKEIDDRCFPKDT